MTDLVQVSRELSEHRANIANITQALANADDADSVNDARERIRIAREWARIHKIAEETHLDLLRLEAVCLRRMYELHALQVLPNHARTAAKFFGQLSTEALEKVLTEFAKCSTAIGIYRAAQRSSADSDQRELGRRIAQGDASVEFESEGMTEAVRSHSTNVRAALAAILDDYASRGHEFSIEEMADDLISDAGLGTFDSEVENGIREVCRTAVRSAPVLDIAGTKMPRFVTCRGTADTGNYVRIPFEKATIRQLYEMILLRREQIRLDQAALARLESAWSFLDEWQSDEDEPLGVVAARAAAGAAA